MYTLMGLFTNRQNDPERGDSRLGFFLHRQRPVVEISLPSFLTLPLSLYPFLPSVTLHQHHHSLYILSSALLPYHISSSFNKLFVTNTVLAGMIKSATRTPSKTTETCTFDICHLGLLDTVRRVCANDSIPSLFPLQGIPPTAKPYLTGASRAHLRRYHLDIPASFKCAHTNHTVVFSRQANRDMLYTCVCHESFKLRDSVKRHYQMCKKAAMAAQRAFNVSSFDSPPHRSRSSAR